MSDFIRTLEVNLQAAEFNTVGLLPMSDLQAAYVTAVCCQMHIGEELQLSGRLSSKVANNRVLLEIVGRMS